MHIVLTILKLISNRTFIMLSTFFKTKFVYCFFVVVFTFLGAYAKIKFSATLSIESCGPSRRKSSKKIYFAHFLALT